MPKRKSATIDEVTPNQQCPTESSLKKKIIIPDPSSVHVTELSPLIDKVSTIVHLSDIHIPSDLHNGRRDEYSSIFDQLYTHLKLLAIADRCLIVITGDLLHTKLTIPNETIILAREFLQRLGDIAPTLVIIGNHDFHTQNTERLDSLTVITHQITNVFPLKESGLYELGGILFSFSSLWDNKFIHAKTASLLNLKHLPLYALFHGTVQGSQNENGWLNESHELLKLQDFDGYDAVLLGHIHKRQSFNKPCNIVYAGSLIQQNFGETVEGHGYVLWNTKDHSFLMQDLRNNYVRLTLEVEGPKLQNPDILNAFLDRKQVMVRCQGSLTQSDFKVLQSYLSTISPKIKIVKKPLFQKVILGKIPDQHSQAPIIPDSALIVKLMKIDKQYLDRLLILHEQQCKVVHIENGIKRKSGIQSNWTITKLEFQNILIYGGDHINSLNFQEGIYNLAADNMMGKTSLMSIILIGLFGKSKRTNATEKVLNHESKRGFIRITIDQDNHEFEILRKFTATNHIPDANKTEVQFRMDGVNQADGRRLQKIIQETFGTIEIFATLSMMSTRSSYCHLMRMSDGEKLQHLLNLCTTDDYESFCKNAKVMLDEKQIELKEIEMQTSHLQKMIKRDVIDQTYDLNDVINLKEQLNSLVIRRAEIKNGLADLYRKQGNRNLHLVKNMSKDVIEEKKMSIEREIPNWKSEFQMLEAVKLSDLELQLSQLKNKLKDVKVIDGIDKTIEELQTQHQSKHIPSGTRTQIVQRKFILESDVDEAGKLRLTVLSPEDEKETHRKLKMTKSDLNVLESRLTILHKQISNKMGVATNCTSSALTIIVNEHLTQLEERSKKNDEHAPIEQMRAILHNLHWQDNRATDFTAEHAQTILHFLDDLGSGKFVRNHDVIDHDQDIIRNWINEVNELESEKESLLLKYNQMLSVLKSQILHLKDDLEWYDIEEKIANLFESKIKMQKKDLYERDIKEIESKIHLLKFKELYEQIVHWLSVEQFAIQINVKIQMEREVESEIENVTAKIHHHEQQKRIHATFASVSTLTQEERKINDEIIILKEYQRLMSKNGIEKERLQAKLDSFATDVNDLFTRFTDYSFGLTYETDTATLPFHVITKDNMERRDLERLSGFEALVLSLSLNYASLRVSPLPQCGMLIVDELFDCIDQVRLQEQLPALVAALKECYSTIIVISHRELPSAAIDFKLQIHKCNQFSVIGH
jgi:predicted MPP superfamily phosphohydrolase